MVSIEIVSDNGCGSVFAVGSSESVVDIDVGIACEGLCKFFLALFHFLFGCVVTGVGFIYTDRFAFFLGVEAEIFKQENFTGFQLGCFYACFGSICCKFHLSVERLGNIFLDLRERHLGIDFSFGFSHVAHENNAAAVIENFFDGGEGTADTGVVGHMTVLIQRHVKVYANNSFFSFEIKIVDCHNY